MFKKQSGLNLDRGHQITSPQELYAEWVNETPALVNDSLLRSNPVEKKRWKKPLISPFITSSSSSLPSSSSSSSSSLSLSSSSSSSSSASRLISQSDSQLNSLSNSSGMGCLFDENSDLTIEEMDSFVSNDHFIKLYGPNLLRVAVRCDAPSIVRKLLFQHHLLRFEPLDPSPTLLASPMPSKSSLSPFPAVSDPLRLARSPPFLSTQEDFNSFCAMVAKGQTALIHQVLDDYRTRLDQLDQNGWPPLLTACYYHHVDVINLLLDAGADPNLPGPDDNYPLHYLASVPTSDPAMAAVLRRLLQGTVNVNVQNRYGLAPLHHAVRRGHHDTVLLLLAHGADPNLATARQELPLSFAIQSQHVEITQALLDAGALPHPSAQAVENHPRPAICSPFLTMPSGLAADDLAAANLLADPGERSGLESLPPKAASPELSPWPEAKSGKNQPSSITLGESRQRRHPSPLFPMDLDEALLGEQPTPHISIVAPPRGAGRADIKAASILHYANALRKIDSLVVILEYLDVSLDLENLPLENGTKLEPPFSKAHLQAQRHFQDLQSLSLAGANLQTVPLSVYFILTHLKFLDLSNNPRLTFIHPAVHLLKKLRSLDLTHTKINFLPKELTVLSRLQTVSLQSCPLRHLPGLRKQRDTSDGSRTASLPLTASSPPLSPRAPPLYGSSPPPLSPRALLPSLASSASLSTLSASFSSSSPSFSSAATASLNDISFAQLLKEISGNLGVLNHHLHLVVLGEPGTGKSTLLQSLSHGRYRVDPAPDEGVDGPTAVKDAPISAGKFKLGDTCLNVLECNYQPLFSGLCKNPHAIYLLLFDASKHISHSKLREWLMTLKTISLDRPVPILLVGTHRDIIDPKTGDSRTDLLSEFLIALFPRSQYPGILSIHYCGMATDKRNRRAIEALTDMLAQTITAHPMRQKHLSLRMLTLRHHLKHYTRRLHGTTTGPVVPLSQIHAVFGNFGIASPAALREGSNFLQGIGMCFTQTVSSGEHDRPSSSASLHVIVLDPAWYYRQICTMIHILHTRAEDSGLFVNETLFSPTVCTREWDQISPNLKQHLIHMFFQMALLLRLPSTLTECSLVPSLLPTHPPDVVSLMWSYSPSPTQTERLRTYRFKLLQPEFFPRLLSWFSQLPGIDLQGWYSWKNGTYLSRPAMQQQFLITLNETTYQMDLRIRAPSDNATTILVESTALVDELLECYFPRMMPGVLRRVGCFHCLKQGIVPPFMFSLEECLTCFQEGRHILFCCNLPSRPVHLFWLLPDLFFMGYPHIDAKRWTKGPKLGEGGFGVVFAGHLSLPDEATAAVVSRPIAIKEMHRAIDTQTAIDKYLEFRREVSIHSKLRHPNIVRLYAIAIYPVATLLLEHCDVGDLAAVLSDAVRYPDARLTSLLRLRLAQDIATGMHYLHSLHPSIVHCDLRSPNILLTLTPGYQPDGSLPEFTAKIADFGSARQLRIVTSGFLGNWQWQPPEVLEFGEFTEKADVYSFGVVVWELLTRSFPFDGLPKEPTKQAIIHDGLRLPIADNIPTTIPIAHLLNECWAFYPDDRPTFADIGPHLDGLLHKFVASTTVVNVDTADPEARFVEEVLARYLQPSDPLLVTEGIAEHDGSAIGATPYLDHTMPAWLLDGPSSPVLLGRQEHKSSELFCCMLYLPQLQELWFGAPSGSIHVLTSQFELARVIPVSANPINDLQVVGGNIWVATGDKIVIFHGAKSTSDFRAGMPISKMCPITLAGPEHKSSKILSRPPRGSPAEGAVPVVHTLVWAISTQESCLSIFSAARLRLVRKISLPHEFCPTALLVVGDTMWVGTVSGYLFLYDPSTYTLLRYVKLADTQLRAMVSVQLPSKMSVWITSDDNEVTILNGSGRPLKTHHLISGTGSSILVGGRYVFTAGASAITAFDPVTEQPLFSTDITSFSFSPIITCFGIFGDKRIGFVHSDHIIQTFELIDHHLVTPHLIWKELIKDQSKKKFDI